MNNNLKDTKDVVVPKDTKDVVVPKDTKDVVVPKDTKDVVVPKDTKDVVVPKDAKDVVVPKDTKDVVDSSFTESTYIIAIIAFTISLIYTLFYIFSYDTNESINDSLAFSRMLDAISFCVVFVSSVLLYYLTNREKKYQIMEKSVDNTEKFINGQNVFIISFGILVLYIIIFISGVPMTYETKSFTITILESLLWILLLFILFVELVKLTFDTNLNPIIFKYLKGIILYYKNDIDVELSESKVGPESKEGPESKGGSEVFHVSNNLYNYDEAQSICKSFDSRLATYSEVENSYNNGGEFCGYGWSDGQMILFPTQKATYDKLQSVPGHGNDCGRPGVNGGYMSNATMQFGVNCYGNKPKGVDPTSKSVKDVLIQKNTKDIITDAKIKFLQEHKDKLLVLDSFNQTKWSEY
jgi:hypothetical protein